MKSYFLKIILLPVFIFSFCFPAMAEDMDITGIRELMLSLGLENIEISKTDNKDFRQYQLSYENRTFLHEIKALGALLLGLKNIIGKDSGLEIFPQSNGQVVASIRLNYGDYLNFRDKGLSEEDFAGKVEVELNPVYKFSGKRSNSLFLHSDLTVGPSYTLDQVNGPTILLTPSLFTYLDNGWYFNARYRFPVYNVVNGFDFQKNFTLVPPGFGRSGFDYSTGITGLPLYTTFRSAYSSEGPGISISNELQWLIMGGLFNLNLASGINFNMTDRKSDFSLLPYGQFYLGKLDLLFEGGGGKFLDNVYGGWARVTRQFDSVDIGFSAYRTVSASGSAWLMLFEYNIAIGPEHGINASAFRVTYPRFFPGNLAAGSGLNSSVSVYRTQDFIKRLYPEYIKSHFYYWREGVTGAEEDGKL
jgi:hypothetical protein